MRIRITPRLLAWLAVAAAIAAVVWACLAPAPVASQSRPPVPVDQLGWAGPEGVELAKPLVERMPDFEILGEAVKDNSRKNARLWHAVKKVYGRHLENVPQQVGDCVNWGYRNGAFFLQCVGIHQGQIRGPPRDVFPPYHYGTSRVLVGGGRLSGDGSVGAWAAEAVRLYGVLPADADGVPAYSGSVARQWGRSGPPKHLVDFASGFQVKTVAKIASAVEMRDAICNGYPVPICSDFGSRTFRVVDGRRVANGDDSWAHCMCVVGFDGSLGQGREYFYVLNSWGPTAHPAPLGDEPPGGFWVTWDQAERIARQDDSFALSNFSGFPARSIDFELLALEGSDDEDGRFADRGSFREHPGRGRGFVVSGSRLAARRDAEGLAGERGGVRAARRGPGGQLAGAADVAGRIAAFGGVRAARPGGRAGDLGRGPGGLGRLAAAGAVVRAAAGPAVCGARAELVRVPAAAAAGAAEAFAVGLLAARRTVAVGDRPGDGAASPDPLLHGPELRGLRPGRPNGLLGVAEARLEHRPESAQPPAGRDAGAEGPVRAVRRRADADLRPDPEREGDRPEAGPDPRRNGWVRPDDVPADLGGRAGGVVPGGGGEDEPPGLAGEQAAREWSIARWLARQLIEAIGEFFDTAVDATVDRLARRVGLWLLVAAVAAGIVATAAGGLTRLGVRKVLERVRR